MKQLVKTVLIGYCGYKAIDALVDKHRNNEVKEEEYVSFDDLEAKEEPKPDTAKNVAMFVGGLTLGLAIKPTKKIIQEHYHISIFK